MTRVRDRAITVHVFRFPEDTEWFKALYSGKFIRHGYVWRLIRANYKKRSMVMVRSRKV